MYAPQIGSAVPAKRYRFAGYEAVLLTQIEQVGGIGYEYIVAVFKVGAQDPCYFITSELSDPSKHHKILLEMGFDEEDLPPAGPVTFMLCVFSEDGHSTHGNKQDWSKLELFEPAALDLIAKKFGARPVEVAD